MCTKFSLDNWKGTDHFEDQNLDRRIKLKWAIKNT
jgi:hypothetical protein